MSEKTVRIQRVEREVHHLVALYLQHQVAEAMPALASVTAVDVTSDLRKAVIYFRLVGSDKDIRMTEDILDGYRKRIQKQVAAEIRTKFCPVLDFRYGHAAEVDEVDRLLSELSKGKAIGSKTESRTLIDQ